MSRLDVPLSDRRILVSGASGGIGGAIVDRLRDAGAAVFATDVVGSDTVHSCDVTSETEVAALFAAAGTEGPVTDVVHAAGICMTAPIADTALSDWRRILAVNLDGSFLVAREAARTLPEGGGIVFIASVAGLTGDPLFGAYCASKFGVIALTQVLARELGHRSIRVNAICPGGVRTSMSDQTIREDAARLDRDPEDLHQLYAADPFLGRWADPGEVADACLYLLSDGASYISGHSLVLNGGGNISSHR